MEVAESKKMVIRIRSIMEEKGLNGSRFAHQIGVQPSAISHLLSGRNKPSLDLIQKIISAFPEIDLYWLVEGRDQSTIDQGKSEPIEYPTSDSTEKKEDAALAVEKVIIFYRDGSFAEFNPRD